MIGRGTHLKGIWRAGSEICIVRYDNKSYGIMYVWLLRKLGAWRILALGQKIVIHVLGINETLGLGEYLMSMHAYMYVFTHFLVYVVRIYSQLLGPSNDDEKYLSVWVLMTLPKSGTNFTVR